MATAIRLPRPISRPRPDAGFLRRALGLARASLRRDATLSALAGLNERLLRDIGLDPADIAARTEVRPARGLAR